jgi:predicted nucleotidyltransferase
VTKPVSARSALAVLVSASQDGRLDEMCARFDVAVMSAFGSAITDSSIEPNDLDIGVGFRRDSAPGGAKRRLELWSAFVDLVGYEAVDLVSLDVDNPVLRAEALTGLPLYESVRGEYAEAQIAAVGERRDTAAMRRRNLELMAE